MNYINSIGNYAEISNVAMHIGDRVSTVGWEIGEEHSSWPPWLRVSLGSLAKSSYLVWTGGSKWKTPSCWKPCQYFLSPFWRWMRECGWRKTRSGWSGFKSMLTCKRRRKRSRRRSPSTLSPTRLDQGGSYTVASWKRPSPRRSWLGSSSMTFYFWPHPANPLREVSSLLTNTTTATSSCTGSPSFSTPLR